tara:strand:- start:14085 stop:15083 length:999 start_codon:yes stop_codon:yes gene_type:complete
MIGFVSAQCTDSDGGANYNVKGTTTGLNSFNETNTATDYCVYYGQQGTYGMYLNPGETAVMEYVCNSDGETVNDDLHVCGSYGCDNGKCLERSDVEDVVCEIDFYYQMENDATCTVDYKGITKSCTIKADDGEPGNQCVLDGLYIAKPTPDEGYIGVEGMSGTFEGIPCGEIETVYNTNRFFLNCKNPGEEEITKNCYCTLKEKEWVMCERSDGSFEQEECPYVCSAGKCLEQSEEEVIIPEKEPIEIPEEVSEENKEAVCVGCVKDERCYPLGYRKDSQFCSEKSEFLDQLKANTVCENNFECDSNLCVNSQCVSGSLWQRFMNWLSKLFG